MSWKWIVVLVCVAMMIGAIVSECSGQTLTEETTTGFVETLTTGDIIAFSVALVVTLFASFCASRPFKNAWGYLGGIIAMVLAFHLFTGWLEWPAFASGFTTSIVGFFGAVITSLSVALGKALCGPRDTRYE